MSNREVAVSAIDRLTLETNAITERYDPQTVERVIFEYMVGSLIHKTGMFPAAEPRPGSFSFGPALTLGSAGPTVLLGPSSAVTVSHRDHV